MSDFQLTQEEKEFKTRSLREEKEFKEKYPELFDEIDEILKKYSTNTEALKCIIKRIVGKI